MTKKRNWQDVRPNAKYAVKIKFNDSKSQYEFVVYNREGNKVFNVNESYYINGVINIEDSYWNGVKKVNDKIGEHHNYEIYWHNPYWMMCKDIKV